MRTSIVERNTKETQIKVELCLDGGAVEVSTGIGFFDHTGIALGMAFKQALGDMSGIERYGTFFIPMDESLVQASLDISNRPFLVFKADFKQEKCGDYENCCTEEFWRAFAMNAGITLHIIVLYGANAHHEIEGIFKSVAHALKIAVKRNADGTVLSTKGVL